MSMEHKDAGACAQSIEDHQAIPVFYQSSKIDVVVPVKDSQAPLVIPQDGGVGITDNLHPTSPSPAVNIIRVSAGGMATSFSHKLPLSTSQLPGKTLVATKTQVPKKSYKTVAKDLKATKKTSVKMTADVKKLLGTELPKAAKIIGHVVQIPKSVAANPSWNVPKPSASTALPDASASTISPLSVPSSTRPVLDLAASRTTQVSSTVTGNMMNRNCMHGVVIPAFLAIMCT